MLRNYVLLNDFYLFIVTWIYWASSMIFITAAPLWLLQSCILLWKLVWLRSMWELIRYYKTLRLNGTRTNGLGFLNEPIKLCVSW